MGKLQDFLMESDIRAERLRSRLAPFPFPFVIQSITEGENKAIRRSCQKTDVDKRTRQGGRRLTLTCTTAAWLPPAAWNPTSRTPPCRRNTEFAARKT